MIMKKAALSLSFVFLASFMSTSCQPRKSTGETGVVIWHWMTDREAAFSELAKKYKEETGKAVVFQLYAPSDNYSQKVRVGAQTNTLPDIFGILGESRDLAVFIEAGHVENLSVHLSSAGWQDRFYTEALQTAYFPAGNQFNVPEGTYGIPLDVTTIPFIYNKKLFAKAGLDPENPPKTWTEFLDAGKKLKAVGVTGFVSGWAETWLIYSLITDLAHNLMGPAKVMDTFRGLVPYTDPQWVKVLSAFDELRKAGFADPSLVSLGNKSAEQAFASERSGMTFNGSWAVNVYAGMNPELVYASFAPPALDPSKISPVWGGAGSVFSVNAKSANKEAAIDFLRWLSSHSSAQTLVAMTNNLPAVKGLDREISPVLAGFSRLMDKSIHPNRFPVSENPKVIESLTKGVQSILIGEKSPAEIAESIQKVKRKSLEK